MNKYALPTVAVKGTGGKKVIINESDFDPKTMELYEETKTSQEPSKTQAPNGEGQGEPSREEKITAFLKTLEKNDANFTTTGKPRVKVVEDALGFDVSSEEVEELYNSLEG